MNSPKPGPATPMLIDLPKVEDVRGNLTFIEENSTIPFSIERTYWIYDVPGGQERSGHATSENQEFIVAISGSFDVIVDNGAAETLFNLNRSYFGLYIPNMFWRTIRNFSTNSLCLVICSSRYSAADYIDSYGDFLARIAK